MWGAIVGDVIGSVHEGAGTKTTAFPLFVPASVFTDDTGGCGGRPLRRDLEIAFYGAEDLTPSSFYAEADALRAREAARLTVDLVEPCVTGTT